MPSNTDLADVNEIYVGFLLAGKKWFDNDAKSQFEKKSKIIGKELTEIQKARAEAMVEEVIKWAKSKKYSGRVKKVWWTARPNSLSNAVGKKVDSRKNPTDILVQFTSGPAEGFLGISAKSTSGSGDIGFKNPGIGTVEATLNINLSDIVSTTVAKAIQKFKLPENTAARKDEIRKSPKIQEQTQTIGTELLNKIRDVMYEKLKKLDNKKLKNYILENWLDVSNDLYPPYIKVTGMGSKLGQIKAKVDDPLNNEKLGAILKNNLRLEKVGNDSIGLYAGPQKILKMRAKFESEKLASSLKFSGDPW
jgi:hypothetical protein